MKGIVSRVCITVEVLIATVVTEILSSPCTLKVLLATADKVQSATRVPLCPYICDSSLASF